MTPLLKTGLLATALLAPLGQAVAEVRAVGAEAPEAAVAGSQVAGAQVSGTRVYVALGSAGEVLVIDAARDTVLSAIADLPDVHGLAGSADGTVLVAGQYAETEKGEAAMPPKPPGMSEEVHRAHHAKRGAAAAGGATSFVSVIRADDGSVVRRIGVPGSVHHTAVTPDGRFAVATHPGGGISVIDLTAFEVSATVQTGPSPNYAVASADGKWIYVTNAGNNTVSEVDTGLWIVRRNFVTGAGPGHLALSPGGDRLYVGNVEDGTVSEISLADGMTVRTFPIGGAVHGVDVSDDGGTLFVAALERNRLIAVDLASGQVRSVALEPAPYHLKVIRGTGKVYVSSATEPRIWVVEGETLRVLGEIPIRGEGHQMVVVRR